MNIGDKRIECNIINITYLIANFEKITEREENCGCVILVCSSIKVIIMENNSSDMFSKMLGVKPIEPKPTQDSPKESASTDKTQPAHVEEEKKNDVSTAPVSEKKGDTVGSFSSMSSTDTKKSVNSTIGGAKDKIGEKVKKVNLKLVVIIVVVGIVLLVGAYVGFGVVLPAKTKAAKIRNNYLASEITDIYSNSISGNSLREKIFVSSLGDYSNDVKKAYVEGAISYDAAMSIYSALNSTGLFDGSAIADNKTYVEKLEASKKAFTSGEQLYSQSKYSDALVQFSKVIKDDANYDAAQDYITKCGTQYRESVLSTATQKLSSGDYEGAIHVLEDANKNVASDTEIAAALEKAKNDYADYVKKNALEEGNKLIAEKKYEEVITIIDSALSKNEGDSELLALKNVAESEYVSSVISQADALMAEYDYSKAADVVATALKTLSENATLQKKQEEIETNKPAPLNTLIMINSKGWNWNDGTPKDPFGTDYSYSKNYVILSYYNGSGEYSKYGEFRAYKKYSKLTGRVAPYEAMSENGSVVFKIFADDELVYTSPEITRKTDAFVFNVDIHHADYIKIETSVDSGKNIIFSDLSVFVN